MINSNLARVFVLVILALVAVSGYFQGFLALISSHLQDNNSSKLAGIRFNWLPGLVYLAGAISASAVGVLFYFS